jgi:hypothetical protein
MIKSEFEYHNSKLWIDSFRSSIKGKEQEIELLTSEKDGLSSMLNTLVIEVEEYEKIHHSAVG